MITRLLLFGATGDLAGRFLLPALVKLHAAGKLPDNFRIATSASEQWDDETFRRHAGERLAQHAADVPDAQRDALMRLLHYRASDFNDVDSVARVVRLAASDGTLGDVDENSVTTSGRVVRCALKMLSSSQSINPA
ncbi:MAG TPA: hypothetical protein VGJ93_14935 [Desulfuromonadaceae bacterium]